MKEEIILPPMTDEEIQRIMGFGDGIMFVVKLVRLREKTHSSPEIRAVLGSLAGLLEEKLPDDIRRYTEALYGDGGDEDTAWQ